MYAFPRYVMGYPTNGSSAASLSSSQRSSLIPDVLRRFSASNSSTNAQECAAADRISASSTMLQSSENQQLNENIVRSVPSTRSSPFVCFTCNVVLSSQSALARHCKEICEPEVTRICPVCHWTGERLIRHYANTHSDRCNTGRCSKRTEKACDECKLQLSTSFVTNEAEKAWGCPYCVSCFHTRDLWTRHCYDHQNGNAASWSYQTMIWSLLQHPDLETYRLQYNWDGCNWSEVTEKTRPGLRDALQRHQVPTDFRLPANYRHSEGPGMLVKYAYQYVMTGQPYFHFMHDVLQPGTRSCAQGMVSSQLMSEPPFETALPYSDTKQLPQGPTLLHEVVPSSQGNFRDMSMTQGGCADHIQSLSEQPLAILPVDSYGRVVPQPDADISVAEQSPDEWQTCTRAVTSFDLRPMSDVIEEWIWPMS
jgi:hypothetical protein